MIITVIEEFGERVTLRIHEQVTENLFAPGTSMIDRYGQELLDHYMSMISTKL